MKPTFNKRMAALLGSIAIFSLSACSQVFKQQNPDVRSIQGSHAGEVVLFTPHNMKGIASISFNKYFIATLPAQHKFTQQVCEGNYLLEVRSVRSESEELDKTAMQPEQVKTKKMKGKQAKQMATVEQKEISPIIAKAHVQVKKGAVTYVQLVQDAKKNWQLQEVDHKQAMLEDLKESNRHFVRRLPDAMVKCAK